LTSGSAVISPGHHAIVKRLFFNTLQTTSLISSDIFVYHFEPCPPKKALQFFSIPFSFLTFGISFANLKTSTKTGSNEQFRGA